MGFFEPSPDFAVTLPEEQLPYGYGLEDGELVQETANEFPQISADLDGLMHLGYLTDYFTLFGHAFSIRTLRVGEKLAIAQLVKDFEDTLALGEAVQAATVAACTMLVDSRALSAPLGPHEDQNPISWIKRNFNVVQQWYDPVTESVFDKYQNLLLRQTQAFLELQEK